MHSTSRIVLVGAIAAMLAGCGLWGKKDKPGDLGYYTPGASSEQTSKKNKLEVPPDLITPATDDRFVVPDGTPRTTATYSSYAADRQGTASAPAAEPVANASGVVSVPTDLAGKMQIERAGTERWLVVKGAKVADLWPQLQAFWRDMGFVVINENEGAGLMETDWAENHAKVQGDPFQDLLRRALGTHYASGERDKFRIRLEGTATPGAVEIYVSHRRMEEVNNGNNNDGTHWEPRAAEPDLEAAMLQRIMVRLGTEEKVAQKIVQESKAPETARAHIVSANGTQQLVVDDSMERAWRQVGLALDRTGVVVEDRDRSKGIYYVRYIKEEDSATQKERGNWFARWFGSKKPSVTGQFSVQVTAQDANKTTVAVLAKDGGKAPEESVKSILSLLLDQLK
jgi:outer membrane protein assembly factor BamC